MPAQSAPLSASLLAALDLQQLVQVINMQAIHSIVDPVGCGMPQLLGQLSQLVQSQRVYTAATASVYGSSLRYLLSAPQLAMTELPGGDIAVFALQLPVSLPGLQRLAACAPCVCIRLHGAVPHSLPLDVQRWVQQLQQQHRLQVVLGYSQPSTLGASSQACVWLVIFSRAVTRNALVLPHQRTSAGLSIVSVA